MIWLRAISGRWGLITVGQVLLGYIHSYIDIHEGEDIKSEAHGVFYAVCHAMMHVLCQLRNEIRLLLDEQPSLGNNIAASIVCDRRVVFYICVLMFVKHNTLFGLCTHLQRYLW
jgi:hypothetical protein